MELAPPGAVFSGKTAAWLHGLEIEPCNPIEMTVPPSFRKINPGDFPVLILAASSETLPLSTVNNYSEIVIGQHDSPDTRRLLEFARAQRLPHTWVDPTETTDSAGPAAEPSASQTVLVRLPGGRRSDGQAQPILHFAPRGA